MCGKVKEHAFIAVIHFTVKVTMRNNSYPKMSVK